MNARPRRRRRRPLVRVGLLLAAGALLFLLGVALGRALEETPPPGGTQTVVRTLEPLPLPPATVTVSPP